MTFDDIVRSVYARAGQSAAVSAEDLIDILGDLLLPEDEPTDSTEGVAEQPDADPRTAPLR